MNNPDRFFNLAEQQLNLNSPSPTYWGNLGYWQDTQDYAQACSALAGKLADIAELNSSDHVLDIGFGCGDQLLLWHHHYGLQQLTGYNLSTVQTNLAKERLSHTPFQLHAGSYDDMPKPATFNKVLALDCAYHFADRDAFVDRSYQALKSGGVLALTDLVLLKPALSLKETLCLKAICTLSNIPFANLKPQGEYISDIESLGFTCQYKEGLSQHIFPAFGAWLDAYKQQYPEHNWLKYTATAQFLRWAYRNKTLGYIAISFAKP